MSIFSKVSDLTLLDYPRLYTFFFLSKQIKNLKGDFFCNGVGSGKEGLISCNYSQLVWTGNHQIGELFYSSGLGGVYPKDIIVGELISIDIVDNSNTKLEIKLIASPLESDLFGVIKIWLKAS